MKKKSKEDQNDGLRPEYDLGRLLKTGVQGKYAQRYREGTNLVLLAPEDSQRQRRHSCEGRNPDM